MKTWRENVPERRNGRRNGFDFLRIKRPVYQSIVEKRGGWEIKSGR